MKRQKILPPSSESLLNIPLVAQFLNDSQIRMGKRAIDQNWFYQRGIPISVGGFNPFTRTVYYSATSAFSDWLKDPYSSARIHNVNDRLVREVLFAIHDYLHIWAYLAIDALKPNLRIGVQSITSKNIETFAFLHILTEAVAVVGLDYWYLSTVNLNSICSIGTATRNLAVDYHEEHAHEFRTFSPELEVQSKNFLHKMVKFYCTGEFEGFATEDLKRSPRLIKWLFHELNYGTSQREIIRNWLSYLSPRPIRLSREALSAPIRCDQKWMQDLIQEISCLLWEKIKENKMHRFSSTLGRKEPTWSSSLQKSPDFRFLNLNSFDLDELESLHSFENSDLFFEYFFYQYLSQYDFSSLDPELYKLFDTLKRRKDLPLLRYLARDLKPLPREKSKLKEPRDLLILN